MNRKASLLFLSLGMLAPVLAGCPAKNNPSPAEPEGPQVHPSEDVETPESIDLDYFKITKISNEPHTFTKEEVLQMMVDIAGESDHYEEVAEEIIEFLNTAKISKQQAEYALRLTQGADMNLTSPQGMRKLVEAILSLINSMTNDQLYNGINAYLNMARKEAEKELNNPDLDPYHRYSSSIQINNYSKDEVERYLALAKGETKGDDIYAEAAVVLEEMKNEMDGFVFTQNQLDAIEEEKASIRKAIESYKIPEFLGDYIKNHTTELVKVLTKYAQAAGSIIHKKYEEACVGYYLPRTGEEIEIDDYRLVSPVHGIDDFLSIFTLDDAKDIIKAVAGKSEENQVVFECIRKAVLPVLFQMARPSTDATVLAKRAEFLNKLNALDITAYDNLAKLVIKFTDMVEMDDIQTMMSEDLERVVTMFKDKAATIRGAISALDAREKDQISKLFAIFGIDLFTLIEDTLSYIEGAKVTTPEEQQAFVEHFQEVRVALKESTGNAIGGLFESDEHDDENYHSVSVGYNTIKVGDEIDTSYINSFYNSYYVNGEYRSDSLGNSELVSFTLDTSKFGYATGHVTYKDNEEQVHEFDYDFLVKSAMAPVYFYRSSSISSAYENQWEASKYENVNYISYSFTRYFNPETAGEDKVNVRCNSRMGLYKVGNASWSVGPSVDIEYDYDLGYGFHWYDYQSSHPAIDAVEGGVSHEDGLHEFTYAGETFTYETVTNFEEKLVNYELSKEVADHENADAVSFVATKHYYNVAPIYGQLSGEQTKEYTLDVTDFVSNKEEGTLSFKYNGLTYLFIAD